MNICNRINRTAGSAKRMRNRQSSPAVRTQMAQMGTNNPLCHSEHTVRNLTRKKERFIADALNDKRRK